MLFTGKVRILPARLWWSIMRKVREILSSFAATFLVYERWARLKSFYADPFPIFLTLLPIILILTVLSRSPVLSIAMLSLAACLYLGVSVLTWLRPRAGRTSQPSQRKFR